MAGRWHNVVVEILRELCDEWKEDGRYKKVCLGNSDPIAVSYRKTTYYYQPDLYGLRPREVTDIYEVIDTETEGEAVMDIVYSALVPRVNVLQMVFSEEWKAEAIRDHATILLNRFHDDGKAFQRIYRPKYFVYLPRGTSRSKMKRTLRRELEF